MLIRYTGSSPRVRGTLYEIIFAMDSSGSSPRVRGTYARSVGHGRVSRFIPACAGNITVAVVIAGSVAVHPRVCGEHSRLFCRMARTNGSSPRVRGTCRQIGHRDAQRRFIPACAGNIVSACT